VLKILFANDCLADTGVLPEYFDLPLQSSDAKRSLRVLLLRQRVNPDGCPDIFMPVTRYVTVVTSPSSTVRTLALLNASREFATGDRGLGVRTIEVTKERTSAGGKGGPRIRARDLTQVNYFPTLDNLSLSTTREGRRTYRYTLEFDAVAPSPCHLMKDVTVLLRERPQGGPGQDNGKMHDWLFVYCTGAGGCAETGAQEVRKRYRISSEVPVDYERLLVVVNRLRNGKETRERPFTVLEVR
jgi:hypothetical protein